MSSLVLSSRPVWPLLVTLLASGCSTVVTQSLDPDVNYALKFSEMPLPKAVVINSRVERETPFFLGFRQAPRNGMWEFELVATQSWAAALRTDLIPLEWKAVHLRSDLPVWFSPNPQSFSAFYIEGTSGIVAAHLFIETAPKQQDQVRLFICRY